ncbi:MAG: hypothetical protein JXR49_19385 [Acidobacteria bacterium]|nr:hypothetical protein [Acidobacteriota bacterium]
MEFEKSFEEYNERIKPLQDEIAALEKKRAEIHAAHEPAKDRLQAKVLMRKLEDAVAAGDEQQAAGFRTKIFALKEADSGRKSQLHEISVQIEALQTEMHQAGVEIFQNNTVAVREKIHQLVSDLVDYAVRQRQDILKYASQFSIALTPGRLSGLIKIAGGSSATKEDRQLRDRIWEALF